MTPHVYSTKGNAARAALKIKGAVEAVEGGFIVTSKDGTKIAGEEIIAEATHEVVHVDAETFAEVAAEFDAKHGGGAKTRVIEGFVPAPAGGEAAAEAVAFVAKRHGTAKVAKVAKPAKEKAVKAPAESKMGQVFARLTAGGMTYKEITALTGWTRFGSIFTKAKRDGFALSSVKEGDSTRLFAAKAGKGDVVGKTKRTPSARPQ